MLGALRWIFWLIAQIIVPLRYRVKVDGWDRVRGLSGPVLLLPNHPGYNDPVLILTTFYRAFRPRPVLFEDNFRGPLHPLVTLLRAIPIPDLDQPSREARSRTEHAVTEVIESLRRGENVVLWPSGRVQRHGVEHLGATRALSDILRAVPEASIVLVRTRGVWGSMFTFARTGRIPEFRRCFRNGALLLLANLMVFMPRRRVTIAIERIDRDDLPELERDTVNRWFEARYNVEGPEPPTFVPYHFLFGRREYTFPTPAERADVAIDARRIRPSTRAAVAELLADALGRSPTDDELHLETALEDLGLDSLRRMDLAMAAQRRFGYSADPAPLTVGELMAMAEGLAESRPASPPPSGWFRPPSVDASPRILAETIPGAFVARALTDPGGVASADEISGVLSYARLLVSSLAMSRRFRRLSSENVGLLLPASVACDAMFLGLSLAGKVPVLLNWTTGPANVRHAVGLAGLTHVVSSWRLRDRLGLSIDGVIFLDVEDLADEVGWFERVGTMLAVRCLPGFAARKVPSLAPDDVAAILFTSGSEKAPKAVPLTHGNILANQSGALEAIRPTANDAILGFLPMFHSFGLTVTGLLPLLAGLRVVHHADPTDAGGLARKVGAYRPTLVAGTPAFIGHILDRARPGELDSLRLIFVGAEACPRRLFEQANRVVPNAELVEGYGVTECSPVIAANRPGANRPGSVGRPLSGVEVLITDLETGAVLPPGAMGMLLVSGPSVFPGYLGHEASPFEERQGKRWYVTGDLVESDADGFLHFRGRLKRFLKAGGEMISMPALEEPFAQAFPPDEDGPRVAVEGIDTERGRSIVLFTSEPIALKEANDRLAAAGFSGVMRLDEVRRLDRIPLLGTGKVDYRRLRTLIAGSDGTAASP